jgi:hypothetical protein
MSPPRRSAEALLKALFGDSTQGVDVGYMQWNIIEEFPIWPDYAFDPAIFLCGNNPFHGSDRKESTSTSTEGAAAAAMHCAKIHSLPAKRISEAP